MLFKIKWVSFSFTLEEIKFLIYKSEDKGETFELYKKFQVNNNFLYREYGFSGEDFVFEASGEDNFYKFVKNDGFKEYQIECEEEELLDEIEWVMIPELRDRFDFIKEVSSKFETFRKTWVNEIKEAEQKKEKESTKLTKGKGFKKQ